jgi:hypothetical protein
MISLQAPAFALGLGDAAGLCALEGDAEAVALAEGDDREPAGVVEPQPPATSATATAATTSLPLFVRTMSSPD